MAVMRKRAYLFDMDGVLVDNCRYHVLSWLEFAKRHGGKLTEAQVVEWMGAPGQSVCLRFSQSRSNETQRYFLYRPANLEKFVVRDGKGTL